MNTDDDIKKSDKEMNDELDENLDELDDEGENSLKLDKIR